MMINWVKSSANRKLTFIALLFPALASCQTGSPSNALSINSNDAPQTAVVNLAKTAQTCWFKSGDKAFRSFRLAGVALVVSGLSAGLSMLALAIFDYPFGINAIIGLIGSIGVSINAALIIMTALQEDPRAAEGDPDAMADVVMASSRHIVSTTITTVGGFLPLILAGGAKEKRHALPHSRIMIHQPWGGFQGQATDIDIHAREILSIRERLNKILANHTGQDLDTIGNDTERDRRRILRQRRRSA